MCDAGLRVEQPARHLEAGQPGHLHVEKHEVGLQPLDRRRAPRRRCRPGRRPRCRRPGRAGSPARRAPAARRRRATRPQVAAHARDPLRHASSSGISTLAQVPSPGHARQLQRAAARRRSCAAARSRCSGRCRRRAPARSRSSVIPSPSSCTSMIVWPSRRAVLMVMRPPPTLRDRPCLIEFSTSGCSSMLGTMTSSVSGLICLHDAQLRAEAHDLDVEILVDRLELLAQRHEVIGAAHQAAQQARELGDQHARRLGLRADERRDRRQRVEQEVRVDLVRERLDLAPPAAASPAPAADARCARCSRS